MFVIYDLEFTTWEGAQDRGWNKPDEFREIVQIGALRVTSDDLKVDAEFEALVRPVRNPTVSTFFEELTGTTNEEITARGESFPLVFNAFLSFCQGNYALSYGNDMVIIGENIILQMPSDEPPELPLPPFVNIRPYVNTKLPATRELAAGSLGGDLSAGVATSGPSKHNALLDCYGILEALRNLRRNGEPIFSL